MPVSKKGKAKGLGKGIDLLIPATNEDIEPVVEKSEPGTKILQVDINKVEPNREQPRKTFEEEPLQELADSIEKHGVISPINVVDKGDYYQIISGERRWRASRRAGLKEVPVIVREYTEQEIVEVSLIENIQREDLNPIEEAKAFKKLMEFGLKQDEVAERVGKSRVTIANSMRLLNLCEEVQQYVIEGVISSGHARALLGVTDAEKQLELARKIISNKLSVRDVEKAVKNMDKPEKPAKSDPEFLKVLYTDIENNLKRAIGAKVSIQAKDEQKGKIEIEYFSKDELETLVSLLMAVEKE